MNLLIWLGHKFGTDEKESVCSMQSSIKAGVPRFRGQETDKVEPPIWKALIIGSVIGRSIEDGFWRPWEQNLGR